VSASAASNEKRVMGTRERDGLVASTGVLAPRLPSPAATTRAFFLEVWGQSRRAYPRARSRSVRLPLCPMSRRGGKRGHRKRLVRAPPPAAHGPTSPPLAAPNCLSSPSRAFVLCQVRLEPRHVLPVATQLAWLASCSRCAARVHPLTKGAPVVLTSPAFACRREEKRAAQEQHGGKRIKWA